jgi:hypothetical protein
MGKRRTSTATGKRKGAKRPESSGASGADDDDVSSVEDKGPCAEGAIAPAATGAKTTKGRGKGGGGKGGGGKDKKNNSAKPIEQGMTAEEFQAFLAVQAGFE